MGRNDQTAITEFLGRFWPVLDHFPLASYHRSKLRLCNDVNSADRRLRYRHFNNSWHHEMHAIRDMRSSSQKASEMNGTCAGRYWLC